MFIDAEIHRDFAEVLCFSRKDIKGRTEQLKLPCLIQFGLPVCIFFKDKKNFYPESLKKNSQQTSSRK